MNTPPEENTPTGSNTPTEPASAVTKVLALVVPAIAVLHSAALASPVPFAPADLGPPRPAIEPSGLVAATTIIASLGAYRLMRGRKGKGKGKKSDE